MWNTNKVLGKYFLRLIIKFLINAKPRQSVKLKTLVKSAEMNGPWANARRNDR